MEALIGIALIASVVGVVCASQATIGVALVGVGCLFAILARIQQAHVYHRELHDVPPAVSTLFPTRSTASTSARLDGSPLTGGQWGAAAVLVAIFAGSLYAAVVFAQ